MQEQSLTKKDKPHYSFFPDIVLHHSQFDSDKQEIVCEIKTKKGIDDGKSIRLNQDLRKLAAYMTNDVLLYHPFKIGVFILVGGTLSDIKKKYVSYKLVEDKADDIYCISYNIRKDDKGCYIPNVICMSIKEVLQLK